MCSQHHHRCKICKNEYDCTQPDWICPTMNFDENAEMCDVCEKEYWEDYNLIERQDSILDWEPTDE